MYRYAVFGYTIESTAELPELERTTVRGRADWRIAVEHSIPELSSETLIGTELVYGDVHARAYTLADGLRLAFTLPAGSYATVLLAEIMKSRVEEVGDEEEEGEV